MERGKRDRETQGHRQPTQRAGRRETRPAARGADGRTGLGWTTAARGHSPRSKLKCGVQDTAHSRSASLTMNGHVIFQAGPLAGIKMEAKFHRIAKDIEQAPTRYPSRIVVEYDSISAEELQINCPEAPFTAGRDTLLATYEFDEGMGIFEFSGWSTKLTRPPEPPDAE